MANNAQKTLIYVVLGFLPLVFPVIFTPVYTHYLSTEDYGMLNLFNVISGLLIPFAVLAVEQGFGYLYWDYRNDEEGMKNFMGGIICLALIILAFVFLLGMVAGPYLVPLMFSNGDKFYLWPYLVSALVFSGCTVVFRIMQYYYRNKDQVTNYSILSIGYLLLSAAFSFCMIVVFKWGINGVVLGRTCGILLITVIFLYIFVKKFGLVYNPKKNREILLYSLPLLVSSVIGVVAYSADKIIIEKYTDLHQLGLYGFAALIASTADIFVNAISNSFVPGIYKTLIGDDPAKHPEATYQLNQMFLLSSMAVALLVAITPPVVFLLIPEKFYTALQYTPILIMAVLPKAITLYFTQNFYKHKKTVFVLYINLFYLVIVTSLCMLFFHFFGIRGITYAVMIAASLNMVVVFLFSVSLDKYRLNIRKSMVLSAIIFASILTIEIIKLFYSLYWLFDSIPFLLAMTYTAIFFGKELKEYSPKNLFKPLGKKSLAP